MDLPKARAVGLVSIGLREDAFRILETDIVLECGSACAVREITSPECANPEAAIVVAVVSGDYILETNDFDSAAFVVKTDVVGDDGVPGPSFDTGNPDTALVSSAGTVADIAGDGDGVGIWRPYCDDASPVHAAFDAVIEHRRGITSHPDIAIDGDISSDHSIMTGTGVGGDKDAM